MRTHVAGTGRSGATDGAPSSFAWHIKDQSSGPCVKPALGLYKV